MKPCKDFLKKHRLLGLTGAIGAGKSTVAQAFCKRGAKIIDADELAREAVNPGSPALTRISELFGENLIDTSGELDRKKMGNIVFNDPEKRKALEDIVHPEVRRLFFERLEKLLADICQKAKPEGAQQLILYVVPLLFESRFDYKELEKVIVVSAPRELCIERIMKRDRCSEELAEKKLNSQMPIEKKEQMADYIIKNSGTLQHLNQQVSDVYQAIMSESN